ncbi:hypothetical protein HDV06_006979 [Boothiomyces sp. JEL0866]|nr:hypothetical protein HDV06_006979 [Boothiomyces sp. JEL0866]
MLFLLINPITAGFVSTGCFTAIGPLVVQSQTQGIDSCAQLCSQNTTNLYAVLAPNALCSCATSLSSFVAVNGAECSFMCSDGPCGGITGTRVSIYQLTQSSGASLPIITSSTSPSSSATSDPTAVVTEKTVGSGNSINQRQIALYASLGAALVIVIILIIVIYRRKKRLEALPTLPRLNSKRNAEYLLPNLPKTDNMIYTVMTNYQPRRPDELRLNKDDVVAVKTYKNGWATGVNVTSGETGSFPLVCFVSPEVMETAIVIPVRE